MSYPYDIPPMVHGAQHCKPPIMRRRIGVSLDIGWILTCMSNEVYHETIHGRKVTYVDKLYPSVKVFIERVTDSREICLGRTSTKNTYINTETVQDFLLTKECIQDLAQRDTYLIETLILVVL